MVADRIIAVLRNRIIQKNAELAVCVLNCGKQAHNLIFAENKTRKIRLFNYMHKIWKKQLNIFFVVVYKKAHTFF